MSKITIIEGNSNDKDNIRVFMVKGEKGDKGDIGPIADNSLTVGIVESGVTASAEITGTSPNQTLNLVLPKGDKGDQGEKGEKGDDGVFDIDIVFPVGSVYFTAVNTNPSTFLGGTWANIGEGKFIVGVGTGTDQNNVSKTFNAGANSGEYTHTQSTSEMPGHRHYTAVIESSTTKTPTMSTSMTTMSYESGHDYENYTLGRSASEPNASRTSITGSGSAMNITNPSFGLYIWQRTE